MLRRFWREASFELDDLSFARTEFRLGDGEPDLNLSLYACDSAVRVHAEHVGSHLKPPVELVHANVALLLPRATEQTPGDSKFSFTRDVHHELHLQDVEELNHFAASVRAAGAQTTLDCCLATYVQSRLDANDPEWTFCKESGSWRRFLRRASGQVCEPCKDFASRQASTDP